MIAVIEMSQASWLVGAIVPGIARHPGQKLAPEEHELLRLLLDADPVKPPSMAA